MRIYSAGDYKAMSRRAAHIIAAQVTVKPDCVLGLATGSTPIGAYDCLAEWCGNGDVSFSQVKSVNLDEYIGLSPKHEQSYRCFMNKNLFDRVDILSENTNVPNGLAPDPEAECARYDAVIEALGGIDLQLLGLGHNGHIGFNEPSEAFELKTHAVQLAPRTIEANRRFFTELESVPESAITMGIGAIMHARRVLMVVSGADKAEILHKVVCGPVTPRVPASILQLHPDFTIVADEAALALVKQAGVKLCV